MISKELTLLTAAVLRDVAPKNPDAIFVHAGGGDSIEENVLAAAVAAYHAREPLAEAPKVVINGLEYYYRLPGRSEGRKEYISYFLSQGIAVDDLILIASSIHTGKEAENFGKMCAREKWKRTVIAAKPYHGPRCFLNCIEWARKLEIDISFYFLTVNCDWAVPTEIYRAATRETRRGTRLELLKAELKRVVDYRKKYEAGDENYTIATPEEGLRHLASRR